MTEPNIFFNMPKICCVCGKDNPANKIKLWLVIGKDYLIIEKYKDIFLSAPLCEDCHNRSKKDGRNMFSTLKITGIFGTILAISGFIYLNPTALSSINVFVNLFPDIIEMTELENMKLNIKLEAEFKRYFRQNHKNIYRDKYNTSLNVQDSEI